MGRHRSGSLPSHKSPGFGAGVEAPAPFWYRPLMHTKIRQSGHSPSVVVFGFGCLLATLAGPGTGWCADPPDRTVLAERAARYARASFDDFRALLRLANDAHFPAQIAENIAYMRQAFEARGFAVATLETPTVPLLLASRATSHRTAATRTVLVYLQIDGQPVDPSAWHQDDPFEPVLKERSGDGWRPVPWERLAGDEVDPEWRIFGRATADAKGPVAMFLAALDALADMGTEAPYDLKVIMDFEEELGSPNLPAAVTANRERLAAELLIILDGPRHATNRPTLHFGARGIATATLTVFGPRVPQHSGHYGNYAPNPALGLATLLASMKDADGRVTLPGFYDGVSLDSATRTILAKVPDDASEIRQRLGIARPDGVAASYQESIQYPSLNILGLVSGWTGTATRTIIPASATAELDIRLVPESSAERLIGLVREHIEKQGYHLLPGRAPTDSERLAHPRLASFTHEVSYGAFRTDYGTEVGRWLTRALERAFDEEPVRLRMVGGSIPIAPFVTTLGIPAVGVPAAQLDNNQHSPNENLRVGNYLDGLRAYLAILTEPFDGL